VFADTNTVLYDSYRLPLLICAQHGYLKVCWSPYVASEVARVSTREYVRNELRQQQGEGNEAIAKAIIDSIDRVRGSIDGVVDTLEQYWYSPDPNARQYSADVALEAPVRDAQDRPILAGALATGAEYLLTADTATFPHGVEWQGLKFWHPDTFLTAFFQTNPDSYIDVRLDIGDIAVAIPLLPR
jgi:hypothetical protein